MPQKYFYDPDANETMVYQRLSTNGDGTGTVDANVDGSSTPVAFYIQPAAGEVMVLNRMIVTIEDTGNLAAEDYGSVSTLTNGMNMEVTDSSDTTILELPASLRPKSLVGWASLCYDMTEHTFGAGANFAVIRWTFSNSGRPVILKDQQKMKVWVEDNLTGLDRHIFVVQGYKGYGKTGKAS